MTNKQRVMLVLPLARERDREREREVADQVNLGKAKQQKNKAFDVDR